MNKRPNILFALADDASHFGIYGHSFVKTPALDWIAQQGVRFEQAFTANPKCAPSRASILTGRYPWQLEDACNHFCYFPKGLTLMPDLLENAGYHIGYTGKGWAPGDYESAGYQRNPAGIAYQKYRLTPPEGSKINTCDYARNFEDFLQKKPNDTPFYFWFGCNEPHRHYAYGEGIRGGKRMEEIQQVPAYWPDCEETRIDMLDYAYEIEWFDYHLQAMLDLLQARGELENTLILATSDNGCPFPRVKGQMYEQDFHMPMVGMWQSKRSWHGMRKENGFVEFVDIAPTFLQAAGLETPTCMTGHSFLPALQDHGDEYTAHANHFVLFGREKHDLGREGDLGYPVRCIRDTHYLYCKNYAQDRWPAGNPETGYTNCDSSPTKDKVLTLAEAGEDYYYQLAFAKRPGVELYDIQQDPLCLNNIAMQYPELCAQMDALLYQNLLETKDPRLEDPDYFERMPLLSERNATYSWKAYQEGRWEKQPF